MSPLVSEDRGVETVFAAAALVYLGPAVALVLAYRVVRRLSASSGGR